MQLDVGGLLCFSDLYLDVNMPTPHFLVFHTVLCLNTNAIII